MKKLWINVKKAELLSFGYKKQSAANGRHVRCPLYYQLISKRAKEQKKTV